MGHGGEETPAGSEQFTVVLDLPPGEPALFAPTCPPGTPDGARCAATVTIIDNETLEVQSVALSSTPTGGYYHGTGTISFTVNFNGAVTVTCDSTPAAPTSCSQRLATETLGASSSASRRRTGTSRAWGGGLIAVSRHQCSSGARVSILQVAASLTATQ